MQRIFYLMQKEFRQIFREKANLFIIFFMPFVQLLILGFAITTDVRNISVVIVDQDRSVLSRRISDAFSVTKTYLVRGLITSSVKQALRLMDIGKAKVLIVIPPYFEKDLKNAKVPVIQTVLDGVDGNSAAIANGYTTTLFSTLQQNWLSLTNLSRRPAKLHLVNTQPRMLYNPQLESPNNIVPGIICILLTMITLFLTTINIVREKEIGTLEQILVTPIRNHELIIGKILPFAILGFLLFNIGILAAGFIFGIWLKGNLFLLYLLSLLYMLNTLGLGIFFSTIATTQQQAMFFAWFFAIFSIILSGFFIPIENMPDWIQLITYLNPTRYFIEIVRGIFLKASGFTALLPDIIGMVIFGFSIITLSVLRFHKRLS